MEEAREGSSISILGIQNFIRGPAVSASKNHYVVLSYGTWLLNINALQQRENECYLRKAPALPGHGGSIY